MSMYKTIFVTEAEDQNAAGGKILSVNGEISLTGESAFASLNEAVAAVQKVANNAIVIKVASGKYEEFVVINEGVALYDVTVVAVDFNGGNVMVDGKEVSIEKSGLAADAQATILAELNDNNAAEGKIFVAADVAPAGAPTLYVGVDAENNYVVGTPSSSIIVSDSNNISSLIENLIKNPAQPITGTTTTPDLSTGNDAPENNAAGTDTPASTPSDSTSINTADKLNITEDTTLAGTNTVDGTHLVVNNGATLTVEKEATLNNKGFMFAGDDESWSGFGDSQKGGTINIKGEVNTNQTNANADGKITVEGTLNSPIVNVDNGGMSDREAGEVSVVKGGVINAAQMNVMHADSVLNIEGEGSSVNIANTKGSGTSVFFKNSGTTTIKNGGSLVFDMTDGDKVDVSGDKTGLVNDGTLTVENASLTVKSDKGLINNGVFAANNSTITVGTLANSGEFNIAGSKFTADAVSGAGSFIINDNATATELQIGSSSAHIYVKGDATVTGDIKKLTGDFFAGYMKDLAGTEYFYDNVTISGLKINSGHTEGAIKAPGRFLARGNVTITGESEITVGAVKIQDGGVLEYGSVIKANDFNVQDYAASEGDAVFKVQGRVEAVTFIITSDYWYPGNDNFIIDKGGVLLGETRDWTGAHGRFDIQAGNMTVYGYVDANWTSGGGYAYVGNSGLNASLTVDGTYASADSDNGKFVNNGTQTLTIGTYGLVEVINGAEFSWNSTVTNNGAFKANGATISVDKFLQNSDTQAVFNNVDLDVTNFVNGQNGNHAYAVIGGNSKVQIDNLSGYYALRLADGTVLKNGSDIKGSLTSRAQGDITFGETATDIVQIDSFDNNGAGGSTITVNGTLNTNASNIAASTHWFGIYGGSNGAVTTLTGNGTIKSNGFWNIFQSGAIEIEEGLTINIADSWARDLRFTSADVTLNGVINQKGSNNKQTTLKSSNLTISGANAALNVDDYMLVGYDTYYAGGSDTTNAYKSTITVSDGATLSVGGRFIINKDSVVMVDSDSTFSVGTIENNGGSINSTTSGEVVIDRTMNVAGIVKTDTLVLKQGAALSAGSLTVDNLTLSIGSTLALTGKASTVESITVVGDIVPSNSEFTLITSGWDTILTATAGKPAISYKGNTYTVVDYDDSLKGLQFITVGSNLYVKDFGANVTGIYIGDITANTPGYVDANKNGIVDAGDKLTDETGATYEIGKDAFTSLTDALASDALKEDGAKDKVTSVIIDSDIDSDDKLSNVAEQFQNLKEVEWQIEAGANVSDTASFNGNLNLNNDGHLDATITISGDFTFTNTAKDTLVGEYAAYSITGINTGAMAGGYTADDKIVIDNTSGIIGADKGEAYFGGSQVEITGGDASNVTVNAGSLTLTDTTTFGLNADSTILAGKDNIWIPSDQTGKLGNIMVVGSANLSIDGDNSAIGANIENVDHTGTVTFNGNQTYTGDLAANKFVVAAGKNVTVNSNQFDFNELAIAGTLSTDFTSQDSFTKAGSITGTGSFITTHGGAWIINDSVERNFSGFTGSVSMSEANASIVMGKGDAIADSSVSSYFADGTTVTIDGTKAQSVVLAKDGVNTAINFKGDGTINVGAYNIVPDYKDVFADQSEDFSQTLSGVNGEFTGTVNVSEGAVLKLESAIGATKIDLDYEATQSATDVADEYDTQLILNVEDAAKDAVIYGDANDIIVANKDQLLEKDSALNNFEGKVELNANDLTLNGTNTTAATITGTADSVINANADQTLSGNNKDFKGDINVAEGKSLTLQGNMGAANINLDAPSTAATGDVDATKLNLDAADLTLNAEITGDENDQINVLQSATLEKDGALNKFNGDVNVNANTITLNGSNTTAAEFTGTGVIDANKEQTLTGTGALNNFHGEVALEGNTLNLNGENTTDAKFTGTADSVINANADQTLSGNNSDFKGDVNVKEGETLTLQGAMGAATIDLGHTEVPNKTTLVLDKDGLALNAEITGDSDDVIDVEQNASLEKDGALDKFSGIVDTNTDSTISLNGSNVTDAVFNGSGVVDVNAEQTLNGKDALTNFHGEVALDGNTVNLNNTNNTDAEFTGTASGVINANADQIFSGDNSGFKGNVNVDEGKSLTLQGNMGAANINLDAPSTAATGDVDATKLNLDKENIVIESKITGDENDQINVQKSATLSGDNTNFKGDLNITEGVTLTLQNNIGADSIVLGPTEVPNPTTLVLDKDGLALNAEITGDSDDVIDVEQNASLEKDGALDKFSGIVDTNTSSTISLNGSNVTDAVFNGSGVVDVNAEQTLNGKDALTNFHGEVALDGNTVNLNNTNDTDAKFTGTTSGVINANADQTFSGDNSGFKGDLNVAEEVTVTLENAIGAATIDLGSGDADKAATLNLNINVADYTLGATLTGDAADVINVQNSITLSADNSGFKGTVKLADQKDLTITNNLGANTVNFGVNSDLNVTGNAKIDSQFVSTDTSAKVTISAGISATLSALNALNGFTGTVNVVKTDDATSKLILSDANNTSATITGSGIIDADADQIFSGDVSGFGGIYDIETSVTLSGDLADVINAQGNTLNLTNTIKEEVTINSTNGYDLDNLNFGINDIKLGDGDTDDFTNITGSGVIKDFSDNDQDYGDITAATIMVTGSEDYLTIDNLTADINITIDAAQTDDKSDVTIEEVFTGNITVDLKDGEFVKNAYKLATNDAFTEDTVIKLFVNGQETDLQVDDMFIDEISKKAYLLQLKDNTLILTQVHQYSNYVAIDGSWSGKVPYQSVDDEGTERIIGYDAASKLDNAVAYIKGYDTGINKLAGTNKGDATMELMSGAYQLTTGTLMTDANGVTQLILKGREDNNVIISGTLRGSDGRLAADGTPTELIIENVRTTGYVFGGGELTIKNSASIRTSGNAIAAGIANEDSSAALTMNTDTTLTVNGGYFTTSVLTGGSVAFGGDVNVIGDTSVVINNTTDETLTITGNIFGGSYAADGKVTQSGDAYVWVNATEATTLRGNIYVSGFQSSKGELVMTGDSTITFAGNANKLTFTGTVSAIDGDKTNESIVFANFNGKFNGSMIGFDTVVISGDSSLALGRRQTETSSTDLAFTVNGGTKVNTAMYTVRDANAWEFSKHIIIDTTGAMAGRYVIVDNYKGGFDGFTFKVNGEEQSNLTADGLTYENGKLTYENGKLIYEVTSKSNTIEVDVDAVLNGTLEATNGLNITGITKPTTDTFGVKAIAGDIVDSVLASAKIEGISSTNGIYQLTGADTTVSTDDVWAGLGVDKTGDTLVVWGNTEEFVADTMTEFVNQDLTVGETYSVSTQVAPEDLFKEEYKKNNNGTLA